MRKLLVLIIILLSATTAFGKVDMYEEQEHNEWRVDSVSGRLINKLYTIGGEDNAIGNIVMETKVSDSAIATLQFDTYDFKFKLLESEFLRADYLTDEELQFPQLSELTEALSSGLDMMRRAGSEIDVPIQEMQRDGSVGTTFVKRLIDINRTIVISSISWESSPVMLNVLFNINGTANTSTLILNVASDSNNELFIGLDSLMVRSLYDILTVGAPNQYAVMRAMLDHLDDGR